MSFMQPQIVFGEWYEVDGMNELEFLPADLVDHPETMVLGQWCEPEHEDKDNDEIRRFLVDLADYIETDVDMVCQVRRIEGWGARMSAAGFLDCTEWVVFPTQQEARDYLDEMYGEDEQ